MISQEYQFIAHGKLESSMKQKGNTGSGKENLQVFKTFTFKNIILMDILFYSLNKPIQY